MIMLRSCRAYRQLVNFDFILKRLNDCQQNPSNRELYKRFLDCMHYLDYPDNKKQRVYKISGNSSIFINLRAEYGIILFILFAIIGYGLSKDSSFINWLSIVYLLILLELTYRGMFYKKEIKFDAALNIRLLGFNPMMKVIGLGELHDRLIILKLKEERLKRNVQVYKSDIQKVIEQYKISGREATKKDITALEKINKEIWELEYKVRNGNLSHQNFDEVGRDAVKIRDLNVARVKLKNRINKKTDTGHEDPL